MSSTEPGASPLRDTLSILHDGSRARVLHVDDEPNFCDLVAFYLEREGDSIEVLTEHSAEAGLERLNTERVDCVVSDYDMPGTDGLEFLEAVRSEHPDLPFILFTGKGSEEIASDAISAGVTDYIQKRGGAEQYSVLANRIENTVRRRAVEREIRRGFRAIETAREGISFLDEHGRFIYVNQAYADIYGYDREELIGEYWAVLYPEEDVDRVSEEILPAVPVQGRWTGESVHLTRDGTRLVVDHALAYTEDGTLLCLVRDVTEERETERTLARERERFELFVDAVEEYAIFTLDTEGYVTSWNRGAERLKGYDREEILGEHFSIFYPEERIEAGDHEEFLAEALAEGSVEDRGRRVRKDGSTFRADVVITAVFDEDDRHCGFVKVTRDETDRSREREPE
ncbi:PAS domain S-box protein [Salinirubellus sp. GCM10025818]|uniref:PAS domain-containing response regulator n=1 Tax=Salinirubellus TaxID=2162630 RepID=UPI0030CD330C